MKKTTFSIFVLVLAAVIAVLLRYGKSAPNLDVAEGRITEKNIKITVENKVEPVTESQPVINDEPEIKEMVVTATAYCPCQKCCGKTDGITATGTKATAGRTIAVDPSLIPYGTEIIIDGHTYIAEDCGGAINNNKIDVFFDTHEEALDFGKKQITIQIIEGENNDR